MRQQIKKTVWLFNHYAVPPGQPGGNRHYSIAKSLNKKGWNFLIIAASTNHSMGNNTGSIKRPELKIYDGVKFLFLPCPQYTGNGIRRILNIATYFILSLSLCFFHNKKISKPSIIIGSSVHPFAALAGLLTSKMYRVPFVFEIRDLWPETLVRIGRLKPKSMIVKALYFIEGLLFSMSARIISLHPKVYEYVAEKGFDPKKVEWIPNGVELKNFYRQKRKTSPIKRPKIGRFCIAYLGSMGNANDLFFLLRSFRKYEIEYPKGQVSLLMIGGGPLNRRLKCYSGKIGIERIAWYDPVPKELIPPLSKIVDGYIISVKDIPGLYRYGISMNKLYDYLASEKPTIIANSACNDPIKESGAGIAVPAGDVHLLAEAIYRFEQTTPEKRAVMGKLGVEHVAAYYDYENLAGKMDALLSHTL
jgi:glycosyltransferase involved in cell wall biosynthesis